MKRLWSERLPALLFLLPIAITLHAAIFGTVRGIVHDAQHRPIPGAQVKLRAAHSDWIQEGASNNSGEFRFEAVPLGEYVLSVTAPGFDPQQQHLVVTSGGAPILHFPLAVARVNQTVEVSDSAPAADTDSSAVAIVVNRGDIARTPGADRPNSLAMITSYVPSAVIAHDQLHIRGGHQVSWLIDGVPVPNTNIASNAGPQFDPKDIDYIEAQRGGYSAEYGDRAYGVFNVVTRSGFERNREAEVVAGYGSFNQTSDQLSLGSHGERFAYYTSLSGNRSDYGLLAPSAPVVHDLASGGSAFVSLILNQTPADQLRLVASGRGDHYQVPQDAQDINTRDVENERDAFVNFTWMHSWKSGLLLTGSPFYHFNRAHYAGGANDLPVSPNDNRASAYAGGVVTLALTRGRHNARTGLQAFAQHDSDLLALHSPLPGSPGFQQQTSPNGELEAWFLEDQYKLTHRLTVNGGVRATRFSGGLEETAFNPRIGAAFRLPKLAWVLRGFYGRYYQAPPIVTVSGPVLGLAVSQGFGFLPLRGERDEQHEFGLSIPASGWMVDFAQFRTAARNYFDHDVLGNSNIFFPLTLARARIQGWEASVRSPRLPAGVQLQLAYSNQVAQGRGGVTGGFTDFQPPSSNGSFFLDHDQRHTLSLVGHVDLPRRVLLSGTLAYGSGFVDGDGPAHLPAHASGDMSLSKSFRERLWLQLTVINLTNNRFLLDNSNTFGGTHFSEPRQFIGQLKYRFHY